MKVLIDNDLSPHIASAINALVEPRGHHVVALRKKFPPETVDEVWNEALGAEGGWVVISGDTTNTKRRLNATPGGKRASQASFSSRRGGTTTP